MTIASTSLRVVSNGVTYVGSVELDVPEPAGDDLWRCTVRMPGIDELPAPILGADAMQALALALAYVGRFLQKLRESGSRILLLDADEEFPIEAYFPVLVAPSEPPN